MDISLSDRNTEPKDLTSKLKDTEECCKGPFANNSVLSADALDVSVSSMEDAIYCHISEKPVLASE